MNWSTMATEAATLIHQGVGGMQRGIALLVDTPDLAVIFGNDDYAQDERARLEVELVRQRLDDLGIEELGIGLSHGTGEDPAAGGSWAMLVKSGDTERLAEILNDAWRIVADHQPCGD